VSADRLMSVVLRGGSRLDSVVGPDAPMWGELPEISRFDPSGSVPSPLSVRQWRRGLRFLAALWPDLPVSRLSEVLHDVLAPQFYTRSDIQVVLSGHRLSDAQTPTSEPPLGLLQDAGRMLTAGQPRSRVVRVTRLGEHTVSELDDWLGLSDAWRLRLLDRASRAVSAGWSVRRFGRAEGVSHGMAQRVMSRARQVEAEVNGAF
jgi:hypothetical protein